MIKRHHFGTAMPSGGVHPINLGSHKSKVMRTLIRSAGAKLFFLPKYSPDLNPIEQVFAKRHAADDLLIEPQQPHSERVR